MNDDRQRERTGDGRDAIASAPAERRSHPEDFDVRVGQAVKTRDFSELGVVCEVREGHFRLDVPHARDYWLSKATIAAVHDDAVHLDRDKDQIEDLKLDEPTVNAESPILDASLEAPPQVNN